MRVERRRYGYCAVRRFVSGSVELKSNITLRLSPGAVLRGSGNIEDYPPAPFRHNELGETRSLLWAIGQSDIHITGEGAIDLNDQAFIDFSQFRSDLSLSSGVALDEKQLQETVASHAKPRPTQPIFFHNCQRLRVDGVTIRNAPCWTITFSVCRDIKISQLSIYNNLRTPNCDGIHFCASKDVVVSDSIFVCGDDCIAITGITDWNGIAENYVVANCVMTSRSAALRLGHQASKVRNVTASNLVIKDTNRGLAIFAKDKGWVENVRIQNVVMETRMFAGGWWGKGEPLYELAPMPVIPAPDPKQHIPWLFASEAKGLRVSNVRCVRAEGSSAFSMEPVTANVTNLELHDCEPAARTQE